MPMPLSPSPSFSRIAKTAASRAIFPDHLRFWGDEMAVLTMRGSMGERCRFGLAILDSVVTRLKVVARNDLRKRPTKDKPSPDYLNGDIVSFRQFYGGMENALFVGDKMSTPSVQKLLLASSPAAVLWTVPLQVIDTLQRVLWRWFFAHIHKEVGEANTFAAKPSFAYADAVPAIIVVARVIWIGTPLDHVHVGVEQRMGLVHG